MSGQGEDTIVRNESSDSGLAAAEAAAAVSVIDGEAARDADTDAANSVAPEQHEVSSEANADILLEEQADACANLPHEAVVAAASQVSDVAVATGSQAAQAAVKGAAVVAAAHAHELDLHSPADATATVQPSAQADGSSTAGGAVDAEAASLAARAEITVMSHGSSEQADDSFSVAVDTHASAPAGSEPAESHSQEADATQGAEAAAADTAEAHAASELAITERGAAPDPLGAPADASTTSQAHTGEGTNEHGHAGASAAAADESSEALQPPKADSAMEHADNHADGIALQDPPDAAPADDVATGSNAAGEPHPDSDSAATQDMVLVHAALDFGAAGTAAGGGLGEPAPFEQQLPGTATVAQLRSAIAATWGVQEDAIALKATGADSTVEQQTLAELEQQGAASFSVALTLARQSSTAPTSRESAALPGNTERVLHVEVRTRFFNSF